MPSHDYEEFIAVFAVAFHARPRATKDLDILLDPTPANARKALSALQDFFGGADLGYTVADLLDPRCIIQLGVAPVRIDLVSDLTGLASFEAAWKNRIDARFGSADAHFIGLDDLIRAKKAAGRPQDRADVQVLRRIRTGPQRKGRSSRRRGP